MDIIGDEKLARESAARRVAEMLKFPENLDKLDQLRQRTASKKNAVDTRLKTTVQSQLNDVKDGLSKLVNSVQTIHHIEDNLTSVGTHFEACSALSEHTEKVFVEAQNRDELRTTLEQIDSIFSVPELVGLLEKEIVDESANVLETHHKVAKLEACRDTLLTMMDRERNTSGRTAIEKYFEQVDVISQRFTQRILADLTDPLEMIRKGSGARLVSWLRIIAREEALDKKYKRERHDSVSSMSSLSSITPRAPSRLTSASGLQRSASEEPMFSSFRPKRLKAKFLDKFHQGIGIKFDNMLFHSGDVVSMSAFLLRFDSFYFSDLKIAVNDLPDKFPPEMDIENLYLNEYHSRLIQVVEDLISTDTMDPSEIMKVLEWVPKYRKQMKEDLGIEVTQKFREQLLNSRGGGEAALRAQYLEMLKEKQESWGNNLLATEVAPWMESPVEGGPEPPVPSTTREGLYYTDAPKILFQMIDSQVDVAFTPGNHVNFVMSLLDLCMKTLQKFITAYGESVKRCSEMYYGPVASERPIWLDLYMMACVNNTVTITENYIPQLRLKVNTRKPAELQDYQLINKPLGEAVGMVENIADEACNLLVDIVMADIDEYKRELLKPKWFRSDKAISTIRLTIEDYAKDFREKMQLQFTRPVLQGCWRNILLEYVRGIVEKRFTCKDKSDRTEFMGRLKKEVIKSQELIEDLCKTEEDEDEDVRPPRLSNVISAICHIILSPVGLLFAEWNKIKLDYPDITLNHYEALLDFREDLTIKEIRKIITDQIVKKMSDSERERKFKSKGSTDSAFFSFIKVPNSYDYFGKATEKK